MTWIIVFALIAVAVVAVGILGVVVHLLFSPWLLLAIVAVVAWMKLRPRRAGR